ncbi:MAG TPA: DMT family transporter [Dermatophilaceae bacterium]|nr:DMT family transporter [Dermatophilaceae bacterium]
MTDRKSHLDVLAVTLILACTVVWGLGQVASKVGLREIPALTQAGMRSLGAAVLVALWATWRGVPLRQRDGTWWPGLAAGILFAAEFACIFLGLRYTTVGRMTVFLYLAPFVVALGMPLLLKVERLTRAQMAGLVAAFSGVALAFSEGFTGATAGPQQWLGDTLGVVAALGWGATTLLIRASSLASTPPAKTLLYQLGVSALLLLPLGLLTESAVAWPVNGWVAVSLAFQVIVVGSTSYLVWFWLIRHYPATRLSAFTLLTPVLGLVAGAVLLAEPLTTRLLLALGTVCVGIYLVNRVRVVAPR